jgi:hypothetical protein
VTVAQEFLRVMGMVASPSALMRPAFVARVLARSRSGGKPRRPTPSAVPVRVSGSAAT